MSLLEKSGSKAAAIISVNPFLQEWDFADFTVKKKTWSGDGMNLEAAFGTFPILESDRVILKKIEDSHLEELFEIYHNDHVFTYCGIIPKHNKDTVKNMIGHFERDFLKKARIKWGLFTVQEPDRLLGIIEAFNFNQKVNTLSVGCYLAEQQWGKGLATEALKLLLPYLLHEVNVNRIQAEVMPRNEASKKVLLKNGFLHEGLLRQAALWSGKGIVDLEIYSILQQDQANHQDT